MYEITYVVTAPQARTEVALQLGGFDRIYAAKLDRGLLERYVRIDRIRRDGMFGIDRHEPTVPHGTAETAPEPPGLS